MTYHFEAPRYGTTSHVSSLKLHKLLLFLLRQRHSLLYVYFSVNKEKGPYTTPYSLTITT